jgi:molecular chaperone GrpE
VSGSPRPGFERAEAGPGAADPVEEGVKVTDKRRIDPLTGKLRPDAGVPAAGASAAAGAADPAEGLGRTDPAGSPGTAADRAAEESVGELVADLTSDLKRVHAEYANYRRRVERDRDLAREQAVSGVFAELLPVLDDIGRAREHDELDGAFKAVGESLEAATTRLGLERYGEPGDPFDPTIHEALTHEHNDDVTEPTCVSIYQPGFRFAGRVIRPARVGVAEPS